MTIQARIFLGYFQNKEIKIHLTQSREWEDAKLFSQDLVETRWEEKEYIGIYLTDYSTLEEIKQSEFKIKTTLQFYCPKLNLDKHLIYLFPQLFVS